MMQSQPSPPNSKIRRSLSNFNPTDISKQYALNNQILAAFDSSYGHNLYQVAYAIGMQFVEMALLEIPKHGYYQSSRHLVEKQESARDALRVSQLLQKMIQEEWDALHATTSTGSQKKEPSSGKVKLATQEAELEKVKQFVKLANDQASNTKETKQLEEDRAKLEERIQGTMDTTNFCGQWAEYADLINAAICPQQQQHQQQQGIATRGSFVKTPSSFLLDGSYNWNSSTKSVMRTRNDFIDDNGSAATSTEIFVSSFQRQPSELSIQPTSWNDSSLRASSPWSYYNNNGNDLSFASGESREAFLLQRKTSELEIERALWLSGLEIQATLELTPTPSSSEHKEPPLRRTKSHSDITISVLAALYHEDFAMLCSTSRVRVNHMTTFQGRLPETVNGCTVIAPLLCIHHFHSSWDERGPDMGLPDETIVQVIDEATPTILPEVRQQLGLTKNALIIPSDVHDYLIDRSLLNPEQFVTVCGGNVLDADHVNDFVHQLAGANGPDTRLGGRKVAATLFFHEHVVTIQKLLRDDYGEAWYDLIDSLPSQRTYRQPQEIDDDSSSFVPFAVRVRCFDEESLKALIRWFACSKFSDENQHYIDMYAWDDHEADFDPRVFQAFIWSEM